MADSTILDRMRAHLSQQRSALRHVCVPEWGQGGAPLKIYFYPALSLEERGSVADAFAESSVRGYTSALIAWARTEDGARMFPPAARVELTKRVDAQVLQRVVDEMWSTISGETDGLLDSLGNSAATPSGS